MNKMLLTKHSTFRLKEKQEERGSVQTLINIPLRSCVMKRGVSLSRCIKDESRSLGFGDQKLEPNRPMRHLLRAPVVSD